VTQQEKESPEWGILILLLIWLSILVLSVSGQYLKLLTERGCT
jgi:hypothetical protein